MTGGRSIPQTVLMTTTATTTYTVGTTKSGAKIHRVDSLGLAACSVATFCLTSSRSATHGTITKTAQVEIGTTPVGALCTKCFAGVASVAAPVAAVEPTPSSRPAVAFVTFAEIAEMAAAAGCADRLPEGFATRTNAYGQPEKMSAADAAEFVASIA